MTLILAQIWGFISKYPLVVVIAAVVIYWRIDRAAQYNKGVKDTQTAYQNAPAKISWLHDTLPAPPAVLIPGPVQTVEDPLLKARVDSLLKVNHNLAYELAQTRTAETPFSSRARLRDSDQEVTISGTLFESYYPLDKRFSPSLTFNPLVIPVRSTTSTVTLPPPSRDLIRGVFLGFEAQKLYMGGPPVFSLESGVSFQFGTQIDIDAIPLRWESGGEGSSALVRARGFIFGS